jgi:hypothetical protein
MTERTERDMRTHRRNHAEGHEGMTKAAQS